MPGMRPLSRVSLSARSYDLRDSGAVAPSAATDRASPTATLSRAASRRTSRRWPPCSGRGTPGSQPPGQP